MKRTDESGFPSSTSQGCSDVINITSGYIHGKFLNLNEPVEILGKIGIKV
jgi:hypothetical protein